MLEKNQFFKKLIRFFEQEKGLTVTAGYLILVVMGMMFKNNLYSRFNINIFDFSDMSDFILAPFEDMKILLFATLSVLLIYTFVEIGNRRKKRHFITGKINEWVETFLGKDLMTFIAIAIYVFVASQYYGGLKYKNILNNENQHITIIFEDEKLPKFEEKPILIGVSSKYTFLHFKTKGESIAIPNESVKVIKFLYAKEE